MKKTWFDITAIVFPAETMDSEEGFRRVLDGYTVEALRAMARQMKIFVPATKKRNDILHIMVRSTVGSRLDSAAVARL